MKYARTFPFNMLNIGKKLLSGSLPLCILVHTLRPLNGCGGVLCLLLPLFFFSGCGPKHPPPEPIPERVELPDKASQRVNQWHALLRKKLFAPVEEKLDSVNRFFNRLEFVDDQSHWGRHDYWSTPEEMLRSNGGDCEDFATAKYFSLLSLQIPDEDMRLSYVKSLKLNQPHMVLTYYGESALDPFVLDSLVDGISPSSERPDLLPIYSFNGGGLWLAKQHSSERIGNASGLSLWQDLLVRWRQEAIAGSLLQAGEEY